MAIDFSQYSLPVLLLFNLDLKWSQNEQEEVLNVTSQLDNAIRSLGYETILLPVTENNLDVLLGQYNPRECVVLNWCEAIPGIPHSEWIIPRYLEEHGFTFTGAGSESIILAQDKYRIKRLLDKAGVPTPKWKIFNRDSSIRWSRYPAIVKASREHCSEGIDRNSVVLTPEELKNRIGYICQNYGQPALVEEFIDGRELHVSLWGNGTVEMLPPAEMEFSSFQDGHDRICSYEAKFVPQSEQYQKINTLLPAPLDKQELRTITEICQEAYAVANCRDYARMDLRYRDGKVYVIDINPNADISPDTSTIAAAELVGYSYGEFGRKLIQLAMMRHPVFAEAAGETDSIFRE